MHLPILSYCETLNYLYIIVTYHRPVHVCKYSWTNKANRLSEELRGRLDLIFPS